MVDSVYRIGLQGMKQGLENAVKSSESLSKAFSPNGSGEPLDGIIGLKQAENQVKASATVIRTAEKLDKEILDIIA